MTDPIAFAFAPLIVVLLLVAIAKSPMGRESGGFHIWDPNDPEMNCPTCRSHGRETCRYATRPQQSQLEDYQ